MTELEIQEALRAMREFLADCYWADRLAEDIMCPETTPDVQVLVGVHKMYHGGLTAFLTDLAA